MVFAADPVIVIGVLGSVASIGAVSVGVITWQRQRKARRLPPTPPSPLDQIKCFSILVVDDEVFPYVKQLKNDGFNIERVPDIKRYADIEQFQYEVLLLDVHGIGAGVGATHGGLDLIEYIKQKNPTQRVVSYTAAKWGVDEHDQMGKADAALSKSAGYAKFRSTIEQQFAALLEPDSYVDPIGLAGDDRERAMLAIALILRGKGAEVDEADLVRKVAKDARPAVSNALVHARLVARQLDVLQVPR